MPGGRDLGARIQFKRLHFGVLSASLVLQTENVIILVSHGGSQLTLWRKNMLEDSHDGKLESEEKPLRSGVFGVRRNLLEKCQFFVTDRQTDRLWWFLVSHMACWCKLDKTLQTDKQTNRHLVIIWSSTSPLLFEAAMWNVTGRVVWIKHNRASLCLMYPVNSHIKATLPTHRKNENAKTAEFLSISIFHKKYKCVVKIFLSSRTMKSY